MTRRALDFVLPLVAVAAAAGGGVYLYRQWQDRGLAATEAAAEAAEKDRAPVADGSMPVRITAQARANLGPFDPRRIGGRSMCRAWSSIGRASVTGA
jgi:hypothetical protein